MNKTLGKMFYNFKLWTIVHDYLLYKWISIIKKTFPSGEKKIKKIRSQKVYSIMFNPKNIFPFRSM
jgi:hypothetical protein